MEVKILKLKYRLNCQQANNEEPWGRAVKMDLKFMSAVGVGAGLTDQIGDETIVERLLFASPRQRQTHL